MASQHRVYKGLQQPHIDSNFQLLHASRVTFVVPSCLKVQHRASCQLRTGSSSSPASCAPVLLCSQALPQPQMWLGGVAPTTAWSHLLRSCSRGCLPAPEPEIGAAAETLHVQSRTARKPNAASHMRPPFHSLELAHYHYCKISPDETQLS